MTVPGQVVFGYQSSSGSNTYTAVATYTFVVPNYTTMIATVVPSQPGGNGQPGAPGNPGNPSPGVYQTPSSPSSCFLPGSLVLMADGSLKPIEDVQIGDSVRGRWQVNRVTMLNRPILGKRPLYFINDTYHNTGEHIVWSGEGWSVLDKRMYVEEDWHRVMPVITARGPDVAFYQGVDPDAVSDLRLGTRIGVYGGFETVERILSCAYPEDTQLYNLACDGDRTMYVDHLCVGAWANDIEFDYASMVGT